MCWLENTSDRVDFVLTEVNPAFIESSTSGHKVAITGKQKGKRKKVKRCWGFQLTRNVLASTTSWEPETRAELQKQKSSKRTLLNKPSRN